MSIGRIGVDIRYMRNLLGLWFAGMIANTLIYYNSAILSRLLLKFETNVNAKELAQITKMSLAASRNIAPYEAASVTVINPWKV